MTKYDCGHEVKEIFITKSFPFDIYNIWKETRGYNGDKTECFSCYYNKRFQGEQ